MFNDVELKFSDVKLMFKGVELVFKGSELKFKAFEIRNHTVECRIWDVFVTEQAIKTGGKYYDSICLLFMINATFINATLGSDLHREAPSVVKFCCAGAREVKFHSA